MRIYARKQFAADPAKIRAQQRTWIAGNRASVRTRRRKDARLYAKVKEANTTLVKTYITNADAARVDKLVKDYAKKFGKLNEDSTAQRYAVVRKLILLGLDASKGKRK